MTNELFSVYQFFPDDSYEHVRNRIPITEAILQAKQLSESVGGRIGTTKRIIITDDGDCTVFDWRFGEGVVFPKFEHVAQTVACEHVWGNMDLCTKCRIHKTDVMK